MAASPLANEMPPYSVGLAEVLVNIVKDYTTWKLRVDSDMQGHSLWP